MLKSNQGSPLCPSAGVWNALVEQQKPATAACPVRVPPVFVSREASVLRLHSCSLCPHCMPAAALVNPEADAYLRAFSITMLELHDQLLLLLLQLLLVSF